LGLARGASTQPNRDAAAARKGDDTQVAVIQKAFVAQRSDEDRGIGVSAESAVDLMEAKTSTAARRRKRKLQ
jgi:hypothetical protein